MKVVKLFLDDQETTSTVTCPYCQKSKAFPNAKLRELKHALKAKCSCNQVFELVVNRRYFPRTEVRFEGELFFQGSQERIAQVTIISLSVGGIGFVTDDVSPQVGDTYTILFHLDDEIGTAIHEDIIVRNLRGEVAGAEFLGQEGGYNFDLDFYLMPFDADLKP